VRIRVYLKANTSKTFSLLQFVVVISAAWLLDCLSASLPDLIVPAAVHNFHGGMWKSGKSQAARGKRRAGMGMGWFQSIPCLPG